MPAYTNAPAPTTPTYTPSRVPGRILFDDTTVLFNDTVVQFDGGTTVYTNASAPTSPTYHNAAAPS